jgi:hypothetical protein
MSISIFASPQAYICPRIHCKKSVFTVWSECDGYCRCIKYFDSDRTSSRGVTDLNIARDARNRQMSLISNKANRNVSFGVVSDGMQFVVQYLKPLPLGDTESAVRSSAEDAYVEQKSIFVA